MSRSVLFVDDEPDVLEGLRDLLRRQRHEWQMVFAPGGQAALDELGRQRFDVVVSDMRMPGIDGAALLAHVRETTPDTVRIVLSGHTDVAGALSAIQVAHVFLSKPCDAGELKAVVRRACSLQETLRDERLRRSAAGVAALPSVPWVYEQLRDAVISGDASSAEIAAIVGRDPAMCAKVLQLANSGFFGGGRKVSSVAEAVAYLGVETLKTLVLSESAFDALSPTSSGARLAFLRTHSAIVAKVASRIVASAAAADEAFMAGMLHDLGKLVLAAFEPDYLDEAIALATRDGSRLFEAERSLRGTTHAEVGAYLLALWGLPFAVVESIACHHASLPSEGPLDVPGAVKVANLLAFELYPESDEPRIADALERLASVRSAAELGRWREVAAEEAAPLLG